MQASQSSTKPASGTLGSIQITFISHVLIKQGLRPSVQASQSGAKPAPGTMYIRVKRAKSTIFLHVDPSDSMLHVKRQVSKLTQQVGHTA